MRAGRKGDEKMAIRVIGAGLGRTGTLSLKTALEMLGFDKCHHMIEVFQNPAQIDYWDAAGMGRPVDWDALFTGYQAIVDYPGCRYYRQLLAHYPDAKVLLTVRDPDAWYESARETIYAISTARRESGPPPSSPPPFGMAPEQMQRIGQMVVRDVWQGDFGGRFEDKAHAIEVYKRHNAAVQENVPAEKLLVYQVKEGWEPLCKFLGVPVPEGTPFPHVNDRESFKSRIGPRPSQP
jgi:hypothetical protein